MSFDHGSLTGIEARVTSVLVPYSACLSRHLSGIGCPILGDRRYTPEDVPLQEGGMFLQ